MPGGWDVWGRPWALTDCPVDKVPEISIAHGQNRVNIAVLLVLRTGALLFPKCGSYGRCAEIPSQDSWKEELGGQGAAERNQLSHTQRGPTTSCFPGATLTVSQPKSC